MSTTVGGAGGYFTDEDTVRSKALRLPNPHVRFQGSSLSALKPEKKTWLSDDGCLLNVRDVIEAHAKSVAAVNKQFTPNIHLEIDEKRRRRNKELEDKGRAIADKLNVEVHSCCTRVARLYRGLTDEQPVRQHNKPLSHMMRPSDRDREERKAKVKDAENKALLE